MVDPVQVTPPTKLMKELSHEASIAGPVLVETTQAKEGSMLIRGYAVTRQEPLTLV